MGNYITTCMDCSKSSLAPTDNGVRPQRITDLKTPELRAKGLLDLHYSDLPHIIKQKHI